jgi:hypothetical protein
MPARAEAEQNQGAIGLPWCREKSREAKKAEQICDVLELEGANVAVFAIVQNCAMIFSLLQG